METVTTVYNSITNFFELRDALRWAYEKHQESRPSDGKATKDGLWQSSSEIVLPSMVSDAEGIVKDFKEGQVKFAYSIVSRLALITEYIDDLRQEFYEGKVWEAAYFWHIFYHTLDLGAILRWYRNEYRPDACLETSEGGTPPREMMD